MLLEGYAYVALVAVVYQLQAALSTIAPVALSTSTSSLSWTGLVFWLTLAPLGMLLLPETHFAAVLLVKHLLLGKPRLGPGRQPLMETTWDHLRHYTMGRIMDHPLMHQSGLCWDGTWVASLHYRALGASMGRRVLVPLPTIYEPDLLVIGHDSAMGSHSCMEWGIELQDNCTVTNSCVVDAGCVVETGALLGDYSYLPAGSRVPAHGVYVGAPLLFLRRNRETLSALQKQASPDAAVSVAVKSTSDSTVITFDKPSAGAQNNAALPPAASYHMSQTFMVLGMLIAPCLVMVPSALLVWVASSVLMAYQASLPVQVVVLLVAALLGEQLMPVCLVLVKWLLLGRCKTGTHAFYSAMYTRWLLCTALDGSLNNALGWEGSAFQVWLWRAAGAHVGRDCCLLGGDRMEQDLLNIGDRVVIGQGGILQGHTIENHQLQFSATYIHGGAVLGARASLLPGSQVQPGGQVGPCSLVLKGERIESNTCWFGLPAAPIHSSS